MIEINTINVKKVINTLTEVVAVPPSERNMRCSPLIRNLHLLIEIFNEYISLKHLLSSSIVFKEYKKTYVYWKLNRKYSFKYYCDIEFKLNLDSLICETNKNLSLNLSEKQEEDMDGEMVDLCTFNSDNIKDVRGLADVHTLDIRGCINIKYISALRNVPKLIK